MRNRKTLRERVETRIARKRDDVFLTREFRDLGGADQVLRTLVREKRLVRLGYGVLGADRSRARLQRRPLDAGAGQSRRAGQGAISRHLRYGNTELVLER